MSKISQRVGEKKLGKWLAVCFQTYTWQSLMFALRQRSCCWKIRTDGPCKIVQSHSSKQGFGRIFLHESISKYNRGIHNQSRIEYRCLDCHWEHIFQCARPASINVALHRWRLSNHKRRGMLSSCFLSPKPQKQSRRPPRELSTLCDRNMWKQR